LDVAAGKQENNPPSHPIVIQISTMYPPAENVKVKHTAIIIWMAILSIKTNRNDVLSKRIAHKALETPLVTDDSDPAIVRR